MKIKTQITYKDALDRVREFLLASQYIITTDVKKN